MIRRSLEIVVSCYIISATLLADPSVNCESQIELLKTVIGVPIEKIHEVTLEGGVKAVTQVFQETRWKLRSGSQSEKHVSRMIRHAMALPEAERLKMMNKIENHVQVWLVPLQDPPWVPSNLKKGLPPCEKSHEFHREMAFVGERDGFAWFAYAPIPRWIQMQKKLGLKDGDDHLEAAICGTTVEDRGRYTRNGCLAILGSTGPMVIPYLEAAVKDKHPWREKIIRNLYNSKSEAVTQWLMRQTTSKDEAVRSGARHCLIWSPRKKAMPLYRCWLSEEAGKKEVFRLLKACRAVRMPELLGLLQKVFESPLSIGEYRLAFEMQRELSGQDTPEIILDGERKILRHGFDGGDNFDLKMICEATSQILSSDDLDATAIIAISLATTGSKAGGGSIIRKTGIQILEALPDGRGRNLAMRLARSCKDTQKKRLEGIAGRLQSLKESLKGSSLKGSCRDSSHFGK